MAALRLEELTAKTIVAARNLGLKKGQEAFIAPETYVHAEDQVDPAASWPRVVLDEDDAVVGYIMGTFDPNAAEDFLKAALWKVNVEAKAQGTGVGRFAVEALADEARRRGFHQLTVVWASGEAGPEEFFKAIGFSVVGQTPYGENLGALKLQRAALAMVGPSPDFVEAVLDVVASIPAGRAMSYGDVAAAIGSRAPRGVGQVMAYYGDQVPWWRVVRASGHPAVDHETRALEHFRAEGTPLLWSRDAHSFRVDLARARHVPK